eukprot:4991467-Pleurochrysis_carterae.AAC.1
MRRTRSESPIRRRRCIRHLARASTKEEERPREQGGSSWKKAMTSAGPRVVRNRVPPLAR